MSPRSFQSRTGTLLFVHEPTGDAGVTVRDPYGAWSSWTAADGLPGDGLVVLARAPDGRLVAATPDGVLAERPPDGGAWRSLPAPPGVVLGTVNDLAFGEDGRLWIAREGGGLATVEWR